MTQGKHTVPARQSLYLAWALLAMGSACTGSIDAVATGGPTTDGAVDFDAGGPDGGSKTRNPEVVLRRLNRVELDYTLRDLFGISDGGGGLLTSALPNDGIQHGFDTIPAMLDFSDIHWQLLDELTDELLTTALVASPGNPARERIVVCPFETEGEACVGQIAATFSARAWRRPVDTKEIDELVALWRALIEEEQTAFDAMTGMLQAVLLSPHFLYRVEIDREPGLDSPHPLSPHELAARLSYALWSSLPDEDLRRAADEGELDPIHLVEHAERLLADPRSGRFVTAFAERWLGLDQVETQLPDRMLFPDISAALLRDMRKETQLFVHELLTSDVPLRELLTARWTFANLPLASYYGVAGTNPGLTRDTHARIDLGSTPRVGLLSQGSFLVQTSLPSRTSPVMRGEWVLERVLCAPPPPPPPGVEGLPDVVEATTLREQLEMHRANPSCASCHALMDPIGLGLEEFDAAAKHRTLDNDHPIDSRGTLPDGSSFDGPAELASLLARDPRYSPCVARYLAVWSTGRWLEDSTDGDTVRALVEQAGADAGLRALLLELIQSELFTHLVSTR